MTTAGVATNIGSTPFQPISIVPGPDGNIWYSTGGGASIGKVTPSGVITNYPVPGNEQIRGMNFGPDGNIYYLNTQSNVVGRMDRFGRSLGTTAVTSLAPASDALVTGPDGNVWFPQFGSDRVGKITTAGAVTSYAVQTGANPRTIAVGPDGNLWFTEPGTAAIGRIATDGSGLTEYGLSNGITASSGPTGITSGPDGNMWFTELNINKIAKFVL